MVFLKLHKERGETDRLCENCVAGRRSSVRPQAGVCPSSLVACMGESSYPRAGGAHQVPRAQRGAEAQPACL